MKSAFNEYYAISDEESQTLLSKAFITLDANVLLNFYRYSSNTTDKFFQVLDAIKDRLWIPYQIGLEFHENRINEIISQKATYSDSIKDINQLKSKFEDKNRNPFLSQVNLNLFDVINAELEESSKKFDLYLTHDIVLEKIGSLFNNSTGPKLSEQDLLQIFKEGKERYKNKVPPGFADEKNKPEEHRKYGDLIIWKQLMRQAKDQNRPCIFVTDERKEDWWFLNKSRNIIMPLPELRREFFTETNQIFYSYQPFNFLEKIGPLLQLDIQPEVLEEVKDLATLEDVSINKEIIVLKELRIGEFLKFENELRMLGYDLYVEVVDKQTYILTINLPPISDIKRRFVEHFLEVIKYYNLETVRRGSAGFIN
jgi:hypothetical protein